MGIFVNEKAEGLRFSRLIIPADGGIMSIKVANDAGTFKGEYLVKTDVSMVK